jgi:glucose/arabinose dehydrogenase
MRNALLVFSFLLVHIFPLHAQDATLIEAFEETFDRPVGLEYSNEGSLLIYLVQQNGIIKTLNIDEPGQNSDIWFDISAKIVATGEKGLLGLAFHPDYPTNETFYVNYNFVNSSDELLTRISRFHAPNGVADPGSEEVLLSFEQPGNNHNGGQLTFGPDGYLYISLGDGGGPQNRDNSQDLTDFFGDILRIDVNTESGYAIPEDNPFVGDPAGLDEIYSFGFRNPWRMSFDRETGHLFVADVGEINRESIYLAEKGKNYGWPIVEGTYCFESENCDKSSIEIPFYEYIYDQEDTGRSITGGYVYRGEDNPSLYGKYIYGDFMTGRIWSLDIDHETMTPLTNTLLLESELRIPTFGIDSRGEIYTLGWGSNAKIYRFSPELTLTKATLKSVDGSNGVQLSWDVNRDEGIESFELFKGTAIDSLELYETVAGNSRGITDSVQPGGATFYAVRAIETDGDKGEVSPPVSYYRSTKTVSDSWQIISIPYETEGLSIANTVAYSFDGSYKAVDQLRPGKGYLIRSTVDEGSDHASEGIGVQSATLQLKQGWNLVGGPVGELPSEFLIDSDGILNSTPMYAYSGSAYQEVDTFMPGQGYWLYAEEGGEITLDLEALSSSLPLNTVATIGNKSLNSSENFDKLEFESGGETGVLLVTENRVSSDILNRYRVPPVAPNSVLDVRTNEGFRLAEGNRFEPDVTVKDYPLSVRFASAGDGMDEQIPGSFSRGSDLIYIITVYRNGASESIELMEGELFLIADEYDRMEIQRAEIENEIVKQTELLPNYPNPFNPVTNISYRLSEQQQVTLTVFDASGRRVSTLVDSRQGAGQYNLRFDASGLASGIYFVRFSAGGVLSTQKLTLIK